MHAALLLRLAAQRQDQHSRNSQSSHCSHRGTIDPGNHVQCGSGIPPSCTTSDSCVLSVPALCAHVQPSTAVAGISTSIAAQPACSRSQLGSAVAVLHAPPPAARTVQVQADDSEAPDVPASKNDASLSCFQECRICLSSDDKDQLIRPCSCTGTLAYAHTSCLKLWVQERCMLVCELCGQKYQQHVIQQLEPLVFAGMHQHKSAIAHPHRAVSRHHQLYVPRYRMTKDQWCCLL